MKRKDFLASAAAVSVVAGSACGGITGSVELEGATTVPLLLGDNIPFVTAHIGRRAFAFIFDTGGLAVLTQEVQREFGFASTGSVRVAGAGDAVLTAELVRVPECRLGKARYAGTFVVLPLTFPVSNPFEHLPFGGIVGREFFGALPTTIDYAKRQLTLCESKIFEPKSAGTSLSLRIRDGHPNIVASIDGYPGTFDIDSGSSQMLTLMTPFWQRMQIDREVPRLIDAVIAHGTGGTVFGYAARARTFGIGDFSVVAPVLGLAKSSSGAFAGQDLAGNIGGGILRRFTLTLDVPAGRAYFKPNSTFHDRFQYNRAGLFVNRVGSRQIVELVSAGGPAASAGIRAGDEVLSIDNVRVAEYSLAVLNALWRRPAATVVALEIRRGTSHRNVHFQLRDLV